MNLTTTQGPHIAPVNLLDDGELFGIGIDATDHEGYYILSKATPMWHRSGIPGAPFCQARRVDVLQIGPREAIVDFGGIGEYDPEGDTLTGIHVVRTADLFNTSDDAHRTQRRTAQPLQPALTTQQYLLMRAIVGLFDYSRGSFSRNISRAQDQALLVVRHLSPEAALLIDPASVHTDAYCHVYLTMKRGNEVLLSLRFVGTDVRVYEGRPADTWAGDWWTGNATKVWQRMNELATIR